MMTTMTKKKKKKPVTNDNQLNNMRKNTKN